MRLAALRALRKVDAKASLARLPKALADTDLREKRGMLRQKPLDIEPRQRGARPAGARGA